MFTNNFKKAFNEGVKFVRTWMEDFKAGFREGFDEGLVNGYEFGMNLRRMIMK